ncbi:MAG: hypothetical protein JWM17_2410, partial [Actinobacteria bacterium]|nr:hypothetical protein [Actinomycetota bacterium]
LATREQTAVPEGDLVAHLSNLLSAT